MPRNATVRQKATAVPPRTIPLDDEPLTPQEMRAVEEGRKAFARGDYCTLEEAKAHVAVSAGSTRAPEVQ